MVALDFKSTIISVRIEAFPKCEKMSGSLISIVSWYQVIDVGIAYSA